MATSETYYCFTTITFDHAATCGNSKQICDMLRLIRMRTFGTSGVGIAVLPCERQVSVYCFQFVSMSGEPAAACYPTLTSCTLGAAEIDPRNTKQCERFETAGKDL